jgi:hypothetical protein
MSGGDQASLVQQIKQMERSNPESNRKWEIYCDVHGRSRDPAFHEVTFLQEFLNSYDSIEIPRPTADPEHASLVEQIKQLERAQPEANQKWTSYCDRNGGGNLDPALHEKAFLKAFLDSYDTIVTGFRPGAAVPTDQEHASLVEQIKTLERTDPSAAQKWVSYADTYGGGSRDPARHDKPFLKAFLTLQAQATTKEEMKAAAAGREPATIAEQTAAGGA